MRVTGFSFIKNAVQFDFPIKEAIESILPLCDEVIVAVGDCTDGTRELVQAIHPTKIKIIDTVWNTALNRDGIVLADETNKALQAAFATNSHWLIYIQGDEVLHEDGFAAITQAMEKYKDDKSVDGLLLNYRHFYGSYDYIATSSHWYKNEIRIIKNNANIFSYKDAQGFRKGNNEKLNVKTVDAFVHHYGWVKEPKLMNNKIVNTGSIWGGDAYTEEHIQKSLNNTFDYSEIDALAKFKGSHPKIFEKRLQCINWNFEFDLTYNNVSFKDKLKNLLEKLTGKRPFDYKNYKII
jgi:hypothetical protein